jgi:hypothetical protein
MTALRSPLRPALRLALQLLISRPTASLDLLFAGATSLDPRITFTRASTATYFNSVGTLTSAATDAPRFDYNPSTLAAQGLLIEEARTNLVTYSAQFDNAAWGATQITVTANAITAPDGTVSGDLAVPSTSALSHYFRQVTTVTATAYAFSVFAKAGGYGFLVVVSSGYNVCFNLTTGAVGASSGSGGTPSIQSVGNGWYRCNLVITESAGNSSVYYVPRPDNVSAFWTGAGDGTSGVYFWGAQLEAGAFATSYIPTTTTALTRAADVASVNTLSPWYNATEGTLYAETQLTNTVANGRAGFDLNDGSTNNRNIFRAIAVGGADQNIVRSGGVVVASLASVSTPTTAVRKSASAYAVNNFAFTVNGGTPATSTSGAVPVGITNLLLGSGVGPSEYLNGYLRRITYYPRRLSNAELQALTT